MTTIKQDELCICIPTSEPEEMRNMLIKNLAAAFRWFGSSDEKYSKDGENVYGMAQLLEQLANVEG